MYIFYDYIKHNNSSPVTKMVTGLDWIQKAEDRVLLRKMGKAYVQDYDRLIQNT